MKNPFKKIFSRNEGSIGILLNPFLIALPFTMLIFYLLPLEYDKFKVELIKKKPQLFHDYYYDMDFDGDTEWIAFKYVDWPKQKGANIIVYEEPFSSLVIDQVNLNYKFVENASPIFADYDHNSLAEVYIFLKNDTAIFIAGVEYNDTAQQLIKPTEKYINHVNYQDEVEGFKVYNASSVDLNGDGYDEIIFSLIGQLSAKPREICAYDVYNDTIFRTPKFAIASNSEPIICKLPFEQVNWLITMNTQVYNNYRGSDQLYDDSCGWVLAFDKNLNYQFEPVPNKIGFRNSVQNLPFFNNNETGIISLFNRPKGSDEQESLRIYDLDGNLIRSCFLEKGKRHTLFPHDEKPGKLFWMAQYEPATISLLNTDLEIFRTISLDYPTPTQYSEWGFKRMDLNNDQKKEIIITNLAKKVIIYTPDFTHPVVIPVAWSKRRTAQTIRLHDEEQPILFLKVGDQHLYYHYLSNHFYYWKYPLFAGLYLLSALFFYYLLRIHKQMLKKRYENEKQLYRHQMLSIKNQVDPHFTLNAINNISSMYMSGRNEEANNFLTKFSRLIHRSLMDSDRIETTIGEELRFVSDFLDVQKIRFQNEFDYQSKIEDKSLLEKKIPRQIIHTFVENALKHGLRPRGSGGKLSIEVKKGSGNLIVVIDDNGIGRDVASTKESTGKGMKILDQIIELYEKLTKVKFIYRIEDKQDQEGTAQGTRVIITSSTN